MTRTLLPPHRPVPSVVDAVVPARPLGLGRLRLLRLALAGTAIFLTAAVLSPATQAQQPPATPQQGETSAQAASPPAKPCTAPEYRQFDFWLGNWEVTTPDGTVAGHNRIESILGGCVLRETWTGAKGSNGTSNNIYDQTRGRWHQTWVDGGGLLLVIEGGLEDGSMVLRGETVGSDGKPSRHQISWTARPGGKVRQHWQVSKDGGATWQTAFDGTYSKTP